jgi:hypothetical protein
MDVKIAFLNEELEEEAEGQEGMVCKLINFYMA